MTQDTNDQGAVSGTPQFAAALLDALTAQRNQALNDNARLLASNAALRTQLKAAQDKLAAMSQQVASQQPAAQVA
jgi:cell division septum initiation protein DivIVA